MMRLLILLGVLFAGLAPAEDPAWLGQARHNGRMAAEAMSRSNRVMHAWLKLADPVTGLLPRMENNPN